MSKRVPRPFESLLAEAAGKRAEVRVKPERDKQTGNLVFVAHLHGEKEKTLYLVTGVVVTPVDDVS